MKQNQAYWAKTRNLMFIVLALWAFFSFVVQIFVVELNTFSFIGFPLGYYMGAQGNLIAFVLIIFWYAHRQNKIDDEFGMKEEIN